MHRKCGYINAKCWSPLIQYLFIVINYTPIFPPLVYYFCLHLNRWIFVGIFWHSTCIQLSTWRRTENASSSILFTYFLIITFFFSSFYLSISIYSPYCFWFLPILWQRRDLATHTTIFLSTPLCGHQSNLPWSDSILDLSCLCSCIVNWSDSRQEMSHAWHELDVYNCSYTHHIILLCSRPVLLLDT